MKRLRTSVIVHASEVDSERKLNSLIESLVIRLEIRSSRRIHWACAGPIPIRKSMESDTLWIGVWEHFPLDLKRQP